MHAQLRGLIESARLSLEMEDCFLRNQILMNQSACPGEKAGILRDRFRDERYYQRIFARGLLSSRHRVNIEHGPDAYDLVLTRALPQEPWFAAIEMKLWMSAQGEIEIPGIIADIQKLQRIPRSQADYRLMLIFSANPPKSTDDSIKFLSKKLEPTLGGPLNINQNYDRENFSTFSDDTPENAGRVDFWVSGIEVQPRP
jgi:hypothetical protein